MVADTLISFLAELENHQLLTASQLHEAKGLGEADARQLAANLIRRGWLTPFQVNQIFLGHGHSLRLGPYVLLERLGHGGMGQVYKARHPLLDRIIALKVLAASRLNEPDALTRFRREMQAIGKVSHPNIVQAHDAALDGDVYFLVMELVEGTDLAKLLKQRVRLPVAQACEYVRQAAIGLQHAHERGLVHRDIKPSNLMLATSEGLIKILDLGLARLKTGPEEAAAADLTREGSVMGTPDYIAPEQAVNSRAADGRADIYSLGCTLYHLLAGQPPFPGGSLTEKLLKHQQAEPEPVELLCPDVSSRLGAVVRTMMAKRPGDRFQTPREVANALAPFAAAPVQEPGPAPAILADAQAGTISWSSGHTESGLPRAMPPPLPRPSRAMLVTGLCVGGLVFVLILVHMIGWSQSDKSLPTDGKDGKDGIATSSDKPALADKKPGIVRQAGEPQTLPKFTAGPARLIKDLKGHTATVTSLAFSADGTRLASGAEDNVVRLWDAVTGDNQGQPLRHGDPVRAVAWSADGKRLAAGIWDRGYDASINVWDVTAPSKRQTLAWKDRTGTPSQADVRSLAFSPDGTRLASGGGPLRIWDLEKGGEPAVLSWQKSFPGYLYSVAFAPDGKTLAAGCHETGDKVRLWAVDAPGEPIVLAGNDQAFGLGHFDVRGVVAFAAGGKMLVRVTSGGLNLQQQSGSVRVWDVEAGQPMNLRNTYKIPGGTVFALAGAADGQLRVAVAAGAPGLGLPGIEAAPGDIAIWDSGTGQVRSYDPGHKLSITALAFSPDGTRLATGSVDQSVKLWDLTR